MSPTWVDRASSATGSFYFSDVMSHTLVWPLTPRLASGASEALAVPGDHWRQVPGPCPAWVSPSADPRRQGLRPLQVCDDVTSVLRVSLLLLLWPCEGQSRFCGPGDKGLGAQRGPGHTALESRGPGSRSSRNGTRRPGRLPSHSAVTHTFQGENNY